MPTDISQEDAEAAQDFLATNELKEPIDASPVIIGKEIFMRCRENLYCIAKLFLAGTKPGPGDLRNGS